MKGRHNILADSLSHMQCLGLYERSPPEKPGEECGIMIIWWGWNHPWTCTTRRLHTSHPDVVTLITDSNNEESVIDKHTFQVGDDLFEEDYLNLIFNTLPTKFSIFRWKALYYH